MTNRPAADTKESNVKNFLSQFVPRQSIRENIMPFFYIVAAVMAFYIASVTVPSGLITYATSLVMLGVIGSTALARLNDIRQEQTQARWQMRRLGLMMVFAACLWSIIAPLSGHSSMPTWKEVMLYSGFALTWVTTPGMPPWWRYISGDAPLPFPDRRVSRD